MSGGRGLPKPRHTHATTPVSCKHQFSSAKLHVSMFLDDIASSHDVPMTLTGVFTMLLDIPIATLVGEIQLWVSVSLKLHQVARPPVWDSFVLVFGRLLPYLSIRFNSDLYTCTHTRQGIHDTKMLDIDTFTIMFDVLWYCCHRSLAIRYALLHITNKRYDFTDKGTCNFTALPYLEDYGETTCHMLVSQYFYFIKYILLVNETKNPLHLDVIDRYLQRMGDLMIPDEALPSLESFYPPYDLTAYTIDTI